MVEGRKDKRQFGAIRVPAQLRVEITANTTIPTQTINVSQNGVLLSGHHAKELDDFVRLKLFLPPSQQAIEVLGRVARKFSKNGKDCLGVQFIEMTSIDQNAWLEYISRVESLTVAQGSLTSTSHLLQERKSTGRSSQALIFRFQTDEGLRKFLDEFQSPEGFFIPVPLMKSIGEKIDLVVIRPQKDTTLELEGEVLPPQGQFPSAERMGLKVKMIDSSQKQADLRNFIS